MTPRRAAVAMLSLVIVLPLAGGALAATREPKASAAEPENANAVIVSDAINRFTFSLHEKLGTEPGNLFYSPESISVALGMVYCGAKNQTAQEIASVLGFLEDRPIRPEWLSQAYADHLAALRLA
ncbi:MAG: hypothetical protein NT049_09485, partial [Planctomycetota bacterium]|nr:hypothetical protein [Planctomycetota bacterium]